MKQLFQIALTLIIFTTLRTNAAVIAGPFTNTANGHSYFLLSSNSASMSELEAISLGGHLATINDAAEQQWVFTTFSPLAGSHRMWIGLYQLPGSVEPAGGWVWMSGDPSTYRNWSAIEPDNDTTGGKHQDNCLIYSTAANCSPICPGTWGDRDGNLEAGNAGGVYAIAEVAPNVELSIFQSTNAVLVAWPTETSNSYQLQWSVTPSTNSWFNLGDVVQGTGSTNYLSDPVQADKRFYRLIRTQP